MTIKQIAAFAALLICVALGVGWSSWRLFSLSDQMAAQRSHLYQIRTADPGAQPLRTTYYKTSAVEQTLIDERADAAPGTPESPAADEERPTIGHVIDVAAPVDGRIESVGSCVSEIDESTDVVRGLKAGDHVAKGHVLATLWSADVGERKHRFLTAASQLLFDEAALEQLQSKGATKKELAEAARRRDVSKARLERSEDVLRSLAMGDEQMDALRHEAGKLQRGRPDYSMAEKWEELEIRAPHDGIVASIQVVAGREVEGGSVLFQIVEAKPPAHEVEGDQFADWLEP